MYLKSLEVSNFKSFKGEVTIPLDRGFTAITGPNGSGQVQLWGRNSICVGPKIEPGDSCPKLYRPHFQRR